MVSRFPKWIEFGAFLLAFIAGFINAIGLLGFEHQSISHLSGTATLLGTGFFASDITQSLHLGGILFAFFAGAMISGLLLQGVSLKLGQHYDTALLIEAGLIFTAFYFLTKNASFGHYAASAACGLQNALATTYSGAVIRTTHLTGIFTDLGIMLGQALRGETFDKRKGLLFSLIITGFVFGGTAGWFFFDGLAFKALLIPGFICLILAVLYRVIYKKPAY